MAASLSAPPPVPPLPPDNMAACGCLRLGLQSAQPSLFVFLYRVQRAVSSPY
eukprot:m.36294 g.36294  ORF g.36294 m.36294 type:complete len:52 (-) comp11004_c0_seq1:161-316(-)